MYVLNPRGSPQFLFSFDVSPSRWNGLPVAVRAPIEAPGAAPSIMFGATGPPEEILPFSLRQGVSLLKADFQNLRTEMSIPVVRLPG